MYYEAVSRITHTPNKDLPALLAGRSDELYPMEIVAAVVKKGCPEEVLLMLVDAVNESEAMGSELAAEILCMIAGHPNATAKTLKEILLRSTLEESFHTMECLKSEVCDQETADAFGKRVFDVIAHYHEMATADLDIFSQFDNLVLSRFFSREMEDEAFKHRNRYAAVALRLAMSADKLSKKHVEQLAADSRELVRLYVAQKCDDERVLSFLAKDKSGMVRLTAQRRSQPEDEQKEQSDESAD